MSLADSRGGPALGNAYDKAMEYAHVVEALTTQSFCSEQRARTLDDVDVVALNATVDFWQASYGEHSVSKEPMVCTGAVELADSKGGRSRPLDAEWYNRERAVPQLTACGPSSRRGGDSVELPSGIVEGVPIGPLALCAGYREGMARPEDGNEIVDGVFVCLTNRPRCTSEAEGRTAGIDLYLAPTDPRRYGGLIDRDGRVRFPWSCVHHLDEEDYRRSFP